MSKSGAYVYPEKSLADTCLRAKRHPGQRWPEPIPGDATEHERLTRRTVGKVQADKQQGRKYESWGGMDLDFDLFILLKHLVLGVSVGVSHSSDEAFERRRSEGETLRCIDHGSTKLSN